MAVHDLPASETCAPGRDGVPDSFAGHLLCGDWAINGPAAAWQWLTEHWPVLVSALAAALVVRVGITLAVRALWVRRTAGATWLEITPPVSTSQLATTDLWGLLTKHLPHPSPWRPMPTRLVWEVHATRDRTRCGIWLPPGVDAAAVAKTVQTAWRGARAEPTVPPNLQPTTEQRVAVRVLRPTVPEWTPLLDEMPVGSASRRAQHRQYAPEEDRLRAVYDAMADAGTAGAASLQITVARATQRRTNLVRRAINNPASVRRHTHRPARAALGIIGRCARSLILNVLDLITPGPSRQPTRAVAGDAYTDELKREAVTKQAARPDLLVHVRVTAATTTAAAAKAAAYRIANGYGLLTGRLATRRPTLTDRDPHSRWVPASQMTLAGAVEVAALAGLPAEAVVHGLPAAGSRRRPPTPGVYTAPLPDADSTGHPFINYELAAGGEPAADHPDSAETTDRPQTGWALRQPDDEDDEDLWSCP